MRLATLRGPEAAVTSRRRMLGGMAALVLLPLPGCGLLPRVNEPVNLYTLTPKTTFPEKLPNVDWQLVVETPVAAVSLDTPRIALQRTPLTFEYYANAAWTDNAPAMVQTLLIEFVREHQRRRGRRPRSDRPAARLCPEDRPARVSVDLRRG